MNQVDVIAGNKKRLGILFIVFLIVTILWIYLSFGISFFDKFVNYWEGLLKYVATAYWILMTITFFSLTLRNKIEIYEDRIIIKRGIITKEILYKDIIRFQERNFKREYPGGKEEMIYYYDLFTNKTNVTITSTSYIDLMIKFSYVREKINNLLGGTLWSN